MKTLSFWPVLRSLILFAGALLALDFLVRLLFPHSWAMQYLFVLLLPGWAFVLTSSSWWKAVSGTSQSHTAHSAAPDLQPVSKVC